VSSDFDVAVIGSSFSGALTAMIARRLGWRVLLLERGRHPRFAIGESSTPLASLLLESIAKKYQFPRLLPLTKWGSWQATYPEIGCGLKRGFTFYHHSPNQSWKPVSNRNNELLVAASPNDRISDTHWYRPDFDHFLVREAIDLGVEYQDEVDLRGWNRGSASHRISGIQRGREVSFSARFLVDATGPRGFSHRQLNLRESSFPDFPATEAVFSHFRDVGRWENEFPGAANGAPYPPDDAALHHVFNHGWMWVLRFNNGITSAGFALQRDTYVSPSDRPDLVWNEQLTRLPSVARQFKDAVPTRAFERIPRLSFRGGMAAGERFALLPMAVGFVDPLLSTGFPLTLLGIERIAKIWEQSAGAGDWAGYERETLGDVDAAAALVGELYRNLTHPAAFHSLSMLYFAAASFAEAARRLNKVELAPGFMLRSHPVFGPKMRECIRSARQVPAPELRRNVREAIEPINIAGLAAESKRNWYPARAEDLLTGAEKVQASQDEIRDMLRRTGFQT
jgi:FADH2 O2-dependent halogenase